MKNVGMNKQRLRLTVDCATEKLVIIHTCTLQLQIYHVHFCIHLVPGKDFVSTFTVAGSPLV